ncbi:succinate dehydrogenase assembly factor 1, mitochondrial [Gracilinanus agilis]|uniref:succinate dehydrogenase assembly factor 1, mitochondrial n=1 Tax=Gracilinanus agilis TaxID=191870 RepID=UPI001CFEA4C8|nr:succinate dehydrogenase assembly factor 1, mitochondrial [Gracilinanus agilis]
MSRHSRLQRQVLGLYRELLRAARGKPGAEARVRAEFRERARLPRGDVQRIEYLYRRGRRQLEQLRGGHTTALGFFVPGKDPGSQPATPHKEPPTDTDQRAATDPGHNVPP